MNHNKNLYGIPQNIQTQPSRKQKNEIRTPKVDLFETSNQYFLRLSLPGVKKENLKIFINDQGYLDISGNVETIIPEATKNVIIQEIFQGPFQRKVKIPGAIDKQSIKFNYKNGILEIFMAKK